MSATIEAFLAGVEEKLDVMADSIVQRIEDAKVRAHLGLMELDSQWEAEQAALLRSAGKMKTAGRSVKGAIDRTRVQAHLAADDAEDALASLKDRLRRIEGRVEFLKVSLAHESHAVLDRFSGACRNLSGQLGA